MTLPVDGRYPALALVTSLRPVDTDNAKDVQRYDVDTALSVLDGDGGPDVFL